MGYLLNAMYSVPGIILAFTVHECSHALVAVALGDPTPKNQGRLTLNPGAHISPMGLIMFIIMGFGWAEPVTVNPSNFKHPRRDDLLVSAAGPFSNLIFAMLLFPILIYTPMPGWLYPFIISAYSINLVLFFLNMLPIPPLDGYHVLKSLFMRRNMKFFWKFEQYGFVVLILLSFAGILGIYLSFGSGLVTTFLQTILP